MAAIDLSAEQKFPTTISFATALTWQEVRLPTSPACRTVSVYLSHTGKIAFTGDDSSSDPADGGAVGTHYAPIAALTWMSFNIGPTHATRPASIFIACDHGAHTGHLTLEG